MSGIPNLLIGLSCAGCGGAIEETEGSRLAFCPYCNSALAITADDAGVARLMYKMDVTKPESDSSARKWFGAFPKDRNLVATAVITEICPPMYLPPSGAWSVPAKGLPAATPLTSTKRGTLRQPTTRRGQLLSLMQSNLWSVITCQAGYLGMCHSV